ncbi:MAG TPA: dihydroorotate dehydrogenase [Clostridia bacterium]|nr:dihydroorotate dehydrogenase [Clostridia bacterium]
MKPVLGVNIGGIKMKNPVLTASGTFGYGLEYADFVDIDKLGGITVKGTTLKPRLGNPTPRIAETPAGMLNSVGLQNPGVDWLISDALPKLKKCNTAVIVNIAGGTLEEYGALAEKLNDAEGIDGLEVNISCPNVKKGGVLFGSDPKMAAAVIKEVKANTSLPIIAKLTPNVTRISEIAFACGEAGADGLSLINTLTGMAIDVNNRKPILANVIGGLSGPAIRPVAVRAVWEVYKEVELPIIGMGGIANAGDALEFILAGATGVAVGTASFVNPGTATEVAEGIEEYMLANGIKTIGDLVGVAHG